MFECLVSAPACLIYYYYYRYNAALVIPTVWSGFAASGKNVWWLRELNTRQIKLKKNAFTHLTTQRNVLQAPKTQATSFQRTLKTMVFIC